MVAVNDGIILESCMYRILQRHFRATPYYVQLLEIFHEVGAQSHYATLLVIEMQLYYAIEQYTYLLQEGGSLQY